MSSASSQVVRCSKSRALAPRQEVREIRNLEGGPEVMPPFALEPEAERPYSSNELEPLRSQAHFTVALEERFATELQMVLGRSADVDSAAVRRILGEYPAMPDTEARALRTRYVASVLIKTIRDDLIKEQLSHLVIAFRAIEGALLARYAPLPLPTQSARLEYERRLGSELDGKLYRQALEATAASHPGLNAEEIELFCQWEAKFHVLKAVRASCLLRGDQDGLRALEAEVFDEIDRTALPGRVALRPQDLRVEYLYSHRLRIACRKVLYDIHTAKEQAKPMSEQEFERVAHRSLAQVKRQITDAMRLEAMDNRAMQQAIERFRAW